MRNRPRLEQYQRIVIRLLHNYLAAAKTLIDHSRVAARELYSGTPFLDEYQAMIDKTFLNDPQSRFIQDLRNYALHSAIPVRGATMCQNAEGSWTSYITLDTDALRAWDGWTAKLKQYLQTLGDDVRLDDIVHPYKDRVSGFYKWLWERQSDMHREAFEELHRLAKKWNEPAEGEPVIEIHLD